jgi:D-inositol-3-phosphate glycosyltransferase
MPGLIALEVKRALGVPFVVTFHALGQVRRAHQQKADRFPDERFVIEDRVVAEADHIIATCPQEEEDLIRLYDADPARISIVPCGFDPSELAPRASSPPAQCGGSPGGAHRPAARPDGAPQGDG